MSGSLRKLIRNVRKQAEADVQALRMRKALELIADGRHGETVAHLRRIARAALEAGAAVREWNPEREKETDPA